MSSPHILVFPFMAKGHTIPLLQLTRFLLRCGATVTLLTTPANRPFICGRLSDTTATIIDIPFPQDVQGIPPGIESTDKLPDISLWVDLAVATKLMQPQFEKMLESLSRISFIITDAFLSWTLDSSNKFSIPRLAYYPMGTFPLLLVTLVAQKRFVEVEEDEGLKLVDFPWIKLKKEDFDPVFIDPEGAKGTRTYDYTLEVMKATSKSYGILLNSFNELESAFTDFWNSEIGPPAWCLGPLPLAEPHEIKRENYQAPWWISWLDEMQENGKSVLYVAFGTQVEISLAQFQEVQTGLEESGVNFLWVVRKNGSEIEEGFEERVRNRGIMVREWVDQREILEHESVRGFLCHCGWSSVMESICAKVPILALPMMWEQPLNAKMVTEVVGMGLRVDRNDRLATAVKEFMEGKAGNKVMKKAAEVGRAAARAVEDGGSSWKALNQLISELHAKKIGAS